MTNIIEVNTLEELQTAINNNSNVIIDVWASWCGPCKMMLPMVSSIVTEDTTLTLVKVNADEATGIAKQYNVRSLPTFIFVKDLKVVNTFIGSTTKTDFIQKIQNAFS